MRSIYSCLRGYRVWSWGEIGCDTDRAWFLRQWNDDYVPLSCAILWIASAGRIEAEPCILEQESLRQAQSEMETKLRSGDIEAVGANEEGRFVSVPTTAFVNPSVNLGQPISLNDIFSDIYVLRWGALSEQDWRRGTGDRIEARYKRVLWSRLSVKKNELLRIWKFEQPDTETPDRMSDNDIKVWLASQESRLNCRPPIRIWEEFSELRRYGVTKPRFQTVWREVYPNPDKGRPTKKRRE